MNDRDLAINYLLKNNIITLENSNYLNKINDIYHYIISVLISNIQLKKRLEDSNIVHLFVFDTNAENQNEKITHADGTHVAFLANGRKISIIGISTHCFLYGDEYLKETLLHEITHAAYFTELQKDNKKTGKDHTELFEAMLNQMLALYNRITGENLKNHMNGYYKL